MNERQNLIEWMNKNYENFYQQQNTMQTTPGTATATAATKKFTLHLLSIDSMCTDSHFDCLER